MPSENPLGPQIWVFEMTQSVRNQNITGENVTCH